ncbi:MAG: SUMF1/EgtB/PvdO family nonheme iron enzyme [Planctomycetes bacterium]|nr:SUMF1/EgtB/PvdO family nonheme iron enzyme [Planctomycetota bacterium]
MSRFKVVFLFPLLAVATQLHADQIDVNAGGQFHSGLESLNGSLVVSREYLAESSSDLIARLQPKSSALADDQADSKGKKNAKKSKKSSKKTPKKKKKKIEKPKAEYEKYMNPSLEKRKEDATLAITFLGKKYASYPASKYLKQVAAAKDDAAIEALRYDALVLNNPEVKFDKLLVRTSGSTKFIANWQGNSTYLRKAGKEMKPTFNDEIQILNLKDKSMKAVYDPSDAKEGLMDICLDFSGKKFLYSGVDTKTNTFQVYEMNIDGSGKRQITPHLPEIDNYNGIYLPNGKILFCSTASLNSVPCVGGKDYVGTLFEIGADGKGMRQVTFDQENDWYPWVKENGRVMYHRWEYTDNSHYFTRILLEMNPDGTNNRSIYGSNSYWPNTLFYAKQIPGHTSKFTGIVSGHHGTARAGELFVFDQSKGDFEADGALQRIPGRGLKVEPVIIDNYMSGRWPRFLHPYPISENFFLVSGQIRPGEKWSLYLADTFDNVVKIADGDKQLFEPIPLMARKTPPIIPERRRLDAKDATMYIQDIYSGPGLEGVERGAVAALRLFAYGYAYRMTGNHDALAIEGGWDTKRVLGTVPVEKDGSVMCKIPHSTPISIQPIDKDGNALQVMRSWTAAQPGEVVSCIGCHEPSSMAPTGRPALASRKAPQPIKPWSKHGRIYGFGFKREIQPILDKYCAGCHDGSKAKTKGGHAMPNFKDAEDVKIAGGKSTAHFSPAYMSLHPYVRRPGPESDLHILTPMDYHTSTSELFQMLEKGHKGVELDEEAMRTLRTWADLNVPYHATWKEYKNDSRTQELAAKTVEYKKKYAGIDDDIEWMPEVAKRPAFIKPKKAKTPAAVKLKGWPLKEIGKLQSKEISFGKHNLKLVKIPAGQFVMGSLNGAPDEYPQAVVEIKKPFWMSTTEITNAQLRAFMSEHDSKVIDQQWKDHIYAGYPANKDEMPAIRVTWNEAMKFTKWLSKEIGKKVNLPTEAQWEWAARAGSDKAHFFGNSGFEQYGNFADEQIGLFAVKGVNPKPVKVSQRTPLNDYVPRDTSFDDGKMIPTGTAEYKPNPWGLYDMYGNVAEWTRSEYKQYPYNDTDGRNDITAKVKRVVRGGSWRDRPKTANASYRLPYVQFQKVYNVGFRVIIED